MNTLEKAISEVTYDMVRVLEYGETIHLSHGFELYHYCEDEVIVLNHEDYEDDELGAEIVQFYYNEETEDVEYEVLNKELYERLIAEPDVESITQISGYELSELSDLLCGVSRLLQSYSHVECDEYLALEDVHKTLRERCNAEYERREKAQ